MRGVDGPGVSRCGRGPAWPRVSGGGGRRRGCSTWNRRTAGEELWGRQREATVARMGPDRRRLAAGPTGRGVRLLRRPGQATASCPRPAQPADSHGTRQPAAPPSIGMPPVLGCRGDPGPCWPGPSGLPGRRRDGPSPPAHPPRSPSTVAAAPRRSPPARPRTARAAPHRGRPRRPEARRAWPPASHARRRGLQTRPWRNRASPPVPARTHDVAPLIPGRLRSRLLAAGPDRGPSHPRAPRPVPRRPGAPEPPDAGDTPDAAARCSAPAPDAAPPHRVARRPRPTGFLAPARTARLPQRAVACRLGPAVWSAARTRVDRCLGTTPPVAWMGPVHRSWPARAPAQARRLVFHVEHPGPPQAHAGPARRSPSLHARSSTSRQGRHDPLVCDGSTRRPPRSSRPDRDGARCGPENTGDLCGPAPCGGPQPSGTPFLWVPRWRGLRSSAVPSSPPGSPRPVPRGTPSPSAHDHTLRTDRTDSAQDLAPAGPDRSASTMPVGSAPPRRVSTPVDASARQLSQLLPIHVRLHSLWTGPTGRRDRSTGRPSSASERRRKPSDPPDVRASASAKATVRCSTWDSTRCGHHDPARGPEPSEPRPAATRGPRPTRCCSTRRREHHGLLPMVPRGTPRPAARPPRSGQDRPHRVLRPPAMRSDTPRPCRAARQQVCQRELPMFHVGHRTARSAHHEPAGRAAEPPARAVTPPARRGPRDGRDPTWFLPLLRGWAHICPPRPTPGAGVIPRPAPRRPWAHHAPWIGAVDTAPGRLL